jgi:hypothetical protein
VDDAGGGQSRGGELNPASLSRRGEEVRQLTSEGGGDELQRFSIDLPRTAGSDLREARAAASSAAAADGEARESAHSGMGMTGGSSGAAARTADPAPTCQGDGREEGDEGSKDLASELGEDVMTIFESSVY